LSAVQQLRIGDRELTVYDEGDRSGHVILVHHGTPGAGPPHHEWVRDAAARGARLIAFDRAGWLPRVRSAASPRSMSAA
jgi:hypothetical protein